MKISCLVVIQATCWSSYEYFKQVVFLIIINMDIRINLRVSRLIPRTLKLTTM
jgi:hypothetical protein